MIRINLLTSSSIKNAVTKKKVTFFKPLLISLLSVLIVIAGYFSFKGFYKPASVKRIEPVAQKSITPAHTGPNMVEEVVREIGDKRNSVQNGVLMIPYADMTFPEKVNYEVQFAKAVFQRISRAIPPGIGLKNLEIDDFQTIYAVGIGDTKELVSTTFFALKNERLELLQQPYSYITTNSGKGYRFVITCKADFGVDHTEPFQAWDHTGTRDDISDFLKQVSTVALENLLKLKAKPVQISAQDVGLYRRYLYHFSGNGEYKQFVSFVLSLYSQKVPCAFKKVQLQAGSTSSVSIEFDLLLTVKE